MNARRLALALGACLSGACGAGGRAPESPLAPDASIVGPTVGFVMPTSVDEYRGLVPLELLVDSPSAGLREAGVVIEGERKVLCDSWPPVSGLHCGGELGVWELGLAQGSHTLRAFVTDEAGRTATAELEIHVRPYPKPRWEFEAELGFDPPVIAGQVVLAPADQLYALDREDGSVRWSYDPDQGGPFDSIRGVVADGQRAYAVTSRSSTEALVALDLAEGAVIWEVPLPGVVLARPVFDGQGHIVVADSASDLRAYTREGVLAWSFDADNQGDRIPAPQPAVGPDGDVYALTVGRNQILRVGSDGQEHGRISTANDYHNALALGADGSIYASDDDGLRVYSADGALVRTFPTPGKALEPVRFGTSGCVFLAAEHTGVYVLDADGAVAWQRAMPELLRGTPFEAPDGTLFVGALGYGFAYQVDAAGQPIEELPYCDQPDGFVSDGTLVVCTRHARIYALDRGVVPVR